MILPPPPSPLFLILLVEINFSFCSKFSKNFDNNSFPHIQRFHYLQIFHRNIFSLIKIKIEKMKFKDKNSQQSIKFSTKRVTDLLQPPFNLLIKKRKKIIIHFTIERKIVIRINIRSFNYITQQLIYSREIIRKYFDPSASGWL